MFKNISSPIYFTGLIWESNNMIQIFVQHNFSDVFKTLTSFYYNKNYESQSRVTFIKVAFRSIKIHSGFKTKMQLLSYKVSANICAVHYLISSKDNP